MNDVMQVEVENYYCKTAKRYIIKEARLCEYLTIPKLHLRFEKLLPLAQVTLFHTGVISCV